VLVEIADPSARVALPDRITSTPGGSTCRPGAPLGAALIEAVGTADIGAAT
jgi:hypothetical protein